MSGYLQREWFVLVLASRTGTAKDFPWEHQAESQEHFAAPLRISCLKAALYGVTRNEQQS